MTQIDVSKGQALLLRQLDPNAKAKIAPLLLQALAMRRGA
jgi:hypothetical protein